MKITKRFQLNYNSTNDAGDTILEVNVSWDNPINNDVTADRINAWLVAIGCNLEVVEKQKR
jgi:hypothetical protein